MITLIKTTATILVLLLTLTVANAQGLKGKPKKNDQNSTSGSGAKCFDENSHILNLGIGFGGGNYYSGYRGYGYSYKSSPAFSLSYEQAYPKKLGPGYLGIGAYLGYQSASSTYNYFYDDNNVKGYYYSKHSWNNFMIAARGAYHFDILNFEKGEFYVGLLAGLRIQNYRYDSNNPDPYAYNFYRYNSGNVYPTYSFFVGGRWYFANNVALFGELGYGISYATAGLSFKF